MIHAECDNGGQTDGDDLMEQNRDRLPGPHKYDALQRRINALCNHLVWTQSGFNASRQARYLDDDLNEQIERCTDLACLIDRYKAAHSALRDHDDTTLREPTRPLNYLSGDALRSYASEIHTPAREDAIDIIHLCEDEIDAAAAALAEQGFNLDDTAVTLNRERCIDLRQVTYSHYAIHETISAYNNQQIRRFLPEGTRIWVNGPRDFEPHAVERIMEKVYRDIPDMFLIHANAPGVQQHVSQWAYERKIVQVRCAPDYGTWRFAPDSPAPFKNLERIAKGFGHRRHKPALLITFHDPDLDRQPGAVLNAEQWAKNQKIPVRIGLSKPPPVQRHGKTGYTPDSDPDSTYEPEH